MEIRRIHITEAEQVAALWDHAGRETPDGGPLTDRGRATITGWLRAAASHPLVFCLVAEEDGELIGFRLARILLDELGPGWAGELQEHHGPPEVAAALAEEAVRRLRDAGCGVITAQVASDDAAQHELLSALAFERDVLRFSLYAAAT